MSRTRNAALATAFTYSQFALAMASGFVVFPMLIRFIGGYDIGLWLMTGELVGYLLLGDLGVLALLPWLVAAKDGAGERATIGRDLSDALAIGVFIGIGGIGIAGAIWWSEPEWIGVKPADWAKVRGPLAGLVFLTGIGFPLRAFLAVLGGLQDVIFGGLCSLTQAVLTIGLSVVLVRLGCGLFGLALATGIPPLLTGVAAGVRTFVCYPEITRGQCWPNLGRCGRLLSQGFGVWLGGLGVRLLSASSGLVFAAVGRPEWATVYAATGKLAQVGQSMGTVIPDSGLVGLSQVYGENDPSRTRRTVVCLLLLYLLIPGALTVGLLVVNPSFVRRWLGSDYYAGDDVSTLIAINLMVGSVAGGMFKVVAVVGFRLRIGAATVAYGATAAGLGYMLAREREMSGLAEGALVANLLALLYGLYALRKVHGLSLRDLLNSGIARWFAAAVPMIVVAAYLGRLSADAQITTVAALAVASVIGYALLLRPVIDGAPWPGRIRGWLQRSRLIPAAAPPSNLEGPR